MFNDKFILLADTVKNLGISCEQLGIQYTSKLSTLEVTVSQQTIQIRKLEKQLEEVDDCANLSHQEYQEGWALADSYNVKIQELQQLIDGLKYKDTDEVLIEANIDLGDEEMTNDEKIDGLDAIIEDLIEWELDGMGIDELASHYFNTKKELYKDNPEDLEDMLEYRKQYEDTEVVLYWDTDKKDVQPVTTRKPSWDVSKAPIEFKNPNLDIEV
jgi:hypothetical protein